MLLISGSAGVSANHKPNHWSELPCWCCLKRAHIAFHLIGNLIFGDFQVIARLEIIQNVGLLLK